VVIVVISRILPLVVASAIDSIPAQTAKPRRAWRTGLKSA
jgi:hypothetical protein